MRRIRIAATVLGLALALASCNATAPETASPSASAIASPAAAPSTAPSMTAPSSAPTSPGPSPAVSLGQGAVNEVLDAALATQADQTLRFTTDVRSADPDDSMQPVTGTGQVSFGDPSKFRFASPGVAGTVPATEVIYDGERLFSRGRDTPYLPEDTWVVLDIKPGTMGRELLTRQYGDYSLVLVAPLGVTSAEAAGEETIDSRAVTRYVTQVDIEAARPHLTESLLPAYESHVNSFNCRRRPADPRGRGLGRRGWAHRADALRAGARGPGRRRARRDLRLRGLRRADGGRTTARRRGPDHRRGARALPARRSRARTRADSLRLRPAPGR